MKDLGYIYIVPFNTSELDIKLLHPNINPIKHST